VSKSTWHTIALIFIAIPWTLVIMGAVYEYRRLKR
jgi:hypothetical protein